MSLISGILGEGKEEDRLKMLLLKHPIYEQYSNLWNVGLDAYDGTGGFLDGSYLWPFPREDSARYKSRKLQARYHNYTETLIDIYIRHVMTDVTRNTKDEGLKKWWANVDGRGLPMTDFVSGLLGQALAAGHAGALVDKSSEAAAGPTRADDVNVPYVTTFPAPSIHDWRLDRSGLAAVKLSEAPPIEGLDQAVNIEATGFLLWDREQWARFDHKGKRLGTAVHGLKRVPLAMLRPKPSRRHPFIGKALVTPSVIQALYNRSSEEDSVLRDQAFSLFVIMVPTEATAEDIKAVQDVMLAGVGTTSVSIIKGTADFKTADMEVSETIRKNQQFLISEIYRMAHLRFQRESLEAESAEALRLQRHDLDQMLRGLAEDLTTFEKDLALLHFEWTAAADAKAAMERAAVEIVYPTTFSLVDVEAELREWAQTTAIGLGDTASREIKKRVVTLMLSDLSEKTLDVIKKEIEAAPATTSVGAEGLREGAVERLRAAGVQVAA